MQGSVVHPIVLEAALIWSLQGRIGNLALTLDIGGQNGQGGDAEGEEEEDEEVDEEEWPDEVVFELQEGLRQGVLEQVLKRNVTQACEFLICIV